MQVRGFGVKYKYYNLIIGPIENFNYVRNSVYLSISQKLGDMKMECRSSSALDKADTMQIMGEMGLKVKVHLGSKVKGVFGPKFEWQRPYLIVGPKRRCCT